MKKIMRNLLIAGFTLFLIGGVFYGIGRISGGQEYVENEGIKQVRAAAKRERVIVEKENLGEIQKIEADIEDMDIIVKESEDTSCYLSYNVDKRRGKNPLSYEVDDGTLKLVEKEGYDTFYYVHVDFSFLNRAIGKNKVENYGNTIILYIPQKQLEECELSLDDGDVTMEGLKSEILNVSLKSGDLVIENTDIGIGSVQTDDGDIELSKLSCKELDLQSESGDVNVRLNGKDRKEIEIEAYTESGDVEAARSLKGIKKSDDDDFCKYQRTVKNAIGTLNIQCEDGDIVIR